MADFINQGCLQKKRISSQKDGVKPIYLKCNVYENQFKLRYKSKIFKILEKLLQIYEPGEINSNCFLKNKGVIGWIPVYGFLSLI